MRRDHLRVDAGGPILPASDSGPDWSLDTYDNPSPYVNAAATGNALYSTGATIDLTDPSVPAGTPMSLFQTERWDVPGGSELTWNFPTGAGIFLVRLYFAEISPGIPGTGGRVFNVNAEGRSLLTNFDVYALSAGTKRS